LTPGMLTSFNQISFMNRTLNHLQTFRKCRRHYLEMIAHSMEKRKREDN
jgi:hypothetical protein